jgi:hypothetical protein
VRLPVVMTRRVLVIRPLRWSKLDCCLLKDKWPRDALVGRGTFQPREPYLCILIHGIVVALP